MLVDLDPGFLIGFVVGVQSARQLPQVLASMKQVDNLHRPWKIRLRQNSKTLGPHANDDLLCSATPSALPSLQIDSLAKFLRGLDGTGVGGGLEIADGVTFRIPFRLRRDAAQFDLPRMSRLPFGFALPAHRLFLHYRDSRPVHLYVQDRNRLADDHG